MRSRVLVLGRPLAGVLLAAGMVACGGAERVPRAVATAAAPTVAVAKAGPGDPGPVALAYLRAIVRNDYTAALPLVAPNQREMVKALALGQGPGTLPTVSANVAVGEAVVSGDSASVSIVGRMCRTAAPRNGSAPATQCVENEDPKTDSPVFRIHLIREHARGWKVVFDFTGQDAEAG